MIFLIGGNGLIGSGFKRYFKKKNIPFKNIKRNTKKNFFNKKCDLLIDCNGNGSKRYGIEHPMEDFKASVESVVENLHKIKFKKYLYISTCQVYQSLDNVKYTKENKASIENNINSYGHNKLISENYITKYAKKYLIIRLPYVIGPMLKRNPFYDLLYQKKTFISLDSKINCIHTDSIASISMKLINKNVDGIYNIGSKNTLKVFEIIKLLNLKKGDLKKSNKIKDINNINLKKIKKILSLPDIFDEAKKYFQERQ